jgi:hypothetical protein
MSLQAHDLTPTFIRMSSSLVVTSSGGVLVGDGPPGAPAWASRARAAAAGTGHC